MKKEEEIISMAEEGAKPYYIRHRCFAKDIIRFIQETNYDKLYYFMFDQLVRSATSIEANMVEGGAGSTNKDFINFMHISLKSSNETKYWLCLIRDTIAVNSDRANELITEANELSKIIAAIILNSKKQSKM